MTEITSVSEIAFKTCTCCGVTKDKNIAFHKRNNRPVGTTSTCKECISKKDAEYRSSEAVKTKRESQEYKENQKKKYTEYYSRPEAKEKIKIRVKTPKYKLACSNYQKTPKAIEARKKKYEQYHYNTNRRYKALLNTTKHKRKHLINELTFHQYESLVRENKCHYCSNPLPLAGYGLDRKDSAKGYNLENCVPCCKDCNSIKSNKITYTEMIEVVALLKRLRNEKN